MNPEHFVVLRDGICGFADRAGRRQRRLQHLGSDEPMEGILPLVIGGAVLAAIIAGVAILAGVLSRRRKNTDDDELGGSISSEKK